MSKRARLEKKTLPKAKRSKPRRAKISFTSGTFSNGAGFRTISAEFIKRLHDNLALPPLGSPPVYFSAAPFRLDYAPVALPHTCKRIEDVLTKLTIPAENFRFKLGLAVPGEQHLVPMCETRPRDGWGETLNLLGGSFDLRACVSPQEKIAKARAAMIELFTHEVDEWLFMAGLGPDPHAPFKVSL